MNAPRTKGHDIVIVELYFDSELNKPKCMMVRKCSICRGAHLTVLQESGQMLKAVTVEEDGLQNGAVAALKHVLNGF